MKRKVFTAGGMPAELVRFLSGGNANVVATLDPDGAPSTSLMTWLVARDERRLALCVDSRSRAFRNLVERPPVSIEVLGDGITWGLKGLARVEKPVMSAPPFPSALVEVLVEEARDHSHPGTLFKGPSYLYDEDKQHRLDFERRIYEELLRG